jgi:hypothetical protein
MIEQSKPFPTMIALVKELKSSYGLKVLAVNNEGRELNDYRIQTYNNAWAGTFSSDIIIPSISFLFCLANIHNLDLLVNLLIFKRNQN